jgi:hypothetical protein
MGLLGLLSLGLAACAQMASAPRVPYPPPGYEHRIQSSHVTLFWNCTLPDPGRLQIGGLAFNIWSSQPIRYLELEAVGVDGNERSVASMKTKADDIQIFTNESTPFRIDLPVAGSVSRIDLYYQYLFQEGDHAIIVSSAASVPFRLAQGTVRFHVRDACNPSQHRS